jgi:hypothetical protein
MIDFALWTKLKEKIEGRIRILRPLVKSNSPNDPTVAKITELQMIQNHIQDLEDDFAEDAQMNSVEEYDSIYNRF